MTRETAIDWDAVCIRVEAVRSAKNMARNQFADEIGITKSNYSQFCRGKRMLTAEHLFLISTKFSISLDHLLAGDGMGT